MIDVDRAHELIASATPALAETEEVLLASLGGRVLAEDFAAPFASPRFDNSAVDGYAVRVADVEGAAEAQPVELEVAAVIAAGAKELKPLPPSRCAQIMTGAPLPAGADAVVPVEHTAGFESTRACFLRQAALGANIRRAGEEIVAGAPLIAEGRLLCAGEIGTLATFGAPSARCYRRPRVALFATGDELVAPGEALGGGQIYNSTSFVLAELLRHAGAELVILATARDERETLRRSLADAVARCDVLISLGGVSMGRFDLLRQTAIDLGFEQLFWKIAQKPGKPMLFAAKSETIKSDTIKSDTVMFGLPGNPVSSMSCFVEYVWPTLQRLQGRAASGRLRAELTAPFEREAAKHRFLFGTVEACGGRLLATPTRKHGSHMLTGAMASNGLLSAPPGDKPLLPGEQIDVRLLPGAALC